MSDDDCPLPERPNRLPERRRQPEWPCREAEVLANMASATERRLDHLQDALPEMIRDAVAEAIAGRQLTEDERTWVRLAIRREAQSISVRQAVIEKTLAGLLWAGVAGAGYVLVEFLRARGWWR